MELVSLNDSTNMEQVILNDNAITAEYWNI